jgi:hypothetical protein
VYELTTTKVVTKEVLPDVAAQFIWLKNRKPDKWRDKPEEANAKDNSVEISFTDATNKDWSE